MLEDKAPFKFLLTCLRISGVWRLNSTSKYHKILAASIFILIYSITSVNLTLVIFYAESIDEIAKVITFGCTALMGAVFSLTFLLFNPRVEDFINDLGVELDKTIKLRAHISETCKQLQKSEVRKMTIIVTCLSCGTLGPLFTRTIIVPFFTPIALTDNLPYFFYTWFFQSSIIFYIGFNMTLIQNLYFNFTMIISAYIDYFSSELAELDLSSPDGKYQLVQLVEMHQNITR